MAHLRAWRLASFAADLVPADLPLPTPQGAEVLLRIEACGVCHSDLHIQDGHWDLGGGRKLPAALGGKILPLTLGHEIVGTVVAGGPEAAVRPGGRYAVFPWIGCGVCATCRAGDEHICQGKARALGVFADGGYATHVLIPDPKYLADIGDLPAEQGAPLGCAGLTAYSALRKVGMLGPDRPLLIIGAGGVGLMAIAMARDVTGVAPIVAEPDAARREAALAAGAAQAIDPAAPDAGKALTKATEGVAAAIDFAGSAASFEFAYAALRKGGQLVLVGLLGGAATIALPLHIMRAIRLTGSYVGSLREFHEVVGLARAGRLPPPPVSSRPLDQVNAALGDLRAGRPVGRLVVTP